MLCWIENKCALRGDTIACLYWTQSDALCCAAKLASYMSAAAAYPTSHIHHLQRFHMAHVAIASICNHDSPYRNLDDGYGIAMYLPSRRLYALMSGSACPYRLSDTT